MHDTNSWTGEPRFDLLDDEELNLVLCRIGRLWGSPQGTPEGVELDGLLAVCESYESVHCRE